MSRSQRKRPFAAYCGGSQKQDKRICNRIMRRTGRIKMRVDGEEALFPRHDEALNKYSMDQDGTRHYSPFVPCRSYGWARNYRDWFKHVKAK